jgi:DNA-binding LacI/PurR family transcriptional regulator
VLNNSPLVKPDMRKRVSRAIEELGYQPSSLARALKSGKTMTIGVVAPFFTSPSVVERLRGLVHCFTRSQYDIVLFDVETPIQRDEHLLRLSNRGTADGLVVISLSPDKDQTERFLESAIPVVVVDAVHPSFPQVVIDDVEGGYLATQHLLELGHRRIAFVGDKVARGFHFTSSRDRRAGYLRALAEAAVADDPVLIAEGPHGQHYAESRAEHLLRLPEPPTAIFAASDTQAIGVLDAANRAGLRVPDDLSVIGFDDIEISAPLGLTTVHQPLYDSGLLSGELLLEILAGGASEPVQEHLRLEIISRRTTARRQSP